MLARLTGELVTDAATASRSLLVRLGETEWDDDLLSLFGLGDETMPRIVANDVVVGFTTEYGSEVPVAGIIVDQQGALIAESCLAPGDAKCTFGTGAFLLTNTGQSIKTPSSGLSACVAWRTGSDFTYCYDGQVYTAASAVRWIQELGLIDSPAQMDHVAMEGDEMFVPGLAGLAAPWWDSKPSGAFTNLSLSTARGSLVGAVLEGIAANTAVLTELVKKESGIGLSTLKVDGGLTRSKFLMQAVANLNQVPVEVYASPHATPLGAVALCRKALTHQPLAECVLPWHPIATFEPIWTHAKAADYKEKWNMNVSAIVKEIN
jgi:glycerol kinase